MNLLLQTALVSAVIAVFAWAPKFFPQIDRHSRILLLVGTGGLLSLCFVDLVPDVVKIGGISSMAIILAVWALYTLGHLQHLKFHSKEEEHHHHPHAHDRHPGNSAGYLLVSMTAHCFSSGMFLVLSHELSAKIAATVFLAILAHKSYEALSVSILLRQKIESRAKQNLFLFIYATSFPSGVALAMIGADSLSDTRVLQMLAVVVASFAVGSLLACMIHDFLLPSLRQIQQRRIEATWLALGVILTWVFTSGGT